MIKEQTIWYEPHPVGAERKAELRAKGLAIIDAIFMPADCVQGDGSGEALPPAKFGVNELREALAAKGIEIPQGAKKADLHALLDASE